MSTAFPALTIVIISYNKKQYLSVCLRSLEKQTYTHFDTIIVDNNSTDDSVSFVRHTYPKHHIISLEKNIGYPAANNVALEYCFSQDAEAVLLLNDDTIADPLFVEQLMQTYRLKKGGNLGLIQPVVLLENDHSKINTIGNAIHYCGFGYCKDYNKALRLFPKLDDQEIISVSGAAMLINKKYYQTVGTLDEDFFMYNEDQNYSWRGLLRGYKHYLSAKAVLYHRYSFKKNNQKFYHSEKNRWMMLLENYQWSTLLLLLPVLLFLEVAVLIYALVNGWFVTKLSSYRYCVLNFSNIREKRLLLQSNRVVSDVELIARFDAKLESSVLKPAYGTVLLNTLLQGYYSLIISLKKASEI